MFLICQLAKVLEYYISNLFKVPEAPRKPVPEEKVPAVPKKAEIPPAKGILGIINVTDLAITLARLALIDIITLCESFYLRYAFGC